jgi:hypothetical protein
VDLVDKYCTVLLPLADEKLFSGKSNTAIPLKQRKCIVLNNGNPVKKNPRTVCAYTEALYG